MVRDESQLNELDRCQQDTASQYLNSIALEDTAAPFFLDLFVHDTVKGEKKSKQAAQDDVNDPFDGVSHTVNGRPAFHVVLQVLEAVLESEYIIGTLPIFPVQFLNFH